MPKDPAERDETRAEGDVMNESEPDVRCPACRGSGETFVPATEDWDEANYGSVIPEPCPCGVAIRVQTTDPGGYPYGVVSKLREADSDEGYERHEPVR
jgi:hypothetical protein